MTRYTNPHVPDDEMPSQSRRGRNAERQKFSDDPVASEMLKTGGNEPIKPAWMLRREAEAREAMRRLEPED